MRVTALAPAADGTQIWKIAGDGPDTQPVHFDHYEVRLIERVTPDNRVMPPEPAELGWKETVRVSRFEDTYVAARPIVPAIPFGVPDASGPGAVQVMLGAPRSSGGDCGRAGRWRTPQLD